MPTDKEYKKKVDEERRRNRPKEEDPKLFGSIIIPLPKYALPLARRHAECLKLHLALTVPDGAQACLVCSPWPATDASILSQADAGVVLQLWTRCR